VPARVETHPIDSSVRVHYRDVRMIARARSMLRALAAAQVVA
jgi:hypothetical protein